MSGTALYWLPRQADWNAALRAAISRGQMDWAALIAFARHDLDYTKTLVLDRAMQAVCGRAPPAGLTTRPVRLAVLASSSVEHLLPGIRVAGLRRGLWIQTYVPDYGQYLQALSNPASPLAAFAPDVVLLALDGHHLLASLQPTMARAAADEIVAASVDRCVSLWLGAQQQFACRVIQQAPLPVFDPLLGHNEHRLPGSRAAALSEVNSRLRAAADEHGVDMLSIDRLAADHGREFWHDRALWLKAKYEIRPAAGALYGDQVARLLAARQGRSAKCLVLDLDNTLWGGVIGDDGVEGICLGQGSGPGEAFVALQQYAVDLARRGIILAICSKNDEANARLPFDRHREMVLKLTDIACFVANWDDKATNLRRIARELNIGLDSMVFIDDNPFERDIVRAELPDVAVPELPGDPALFVRAIVDAGYFEATGLTSDDLDRSAQYQANRARRDALAAVTDIGTYLAQLDMVLEWQPFTPVDLKRVAQLINKTNQFNLTTRRYEEDAVRAMMHDSDWLTFQLRLSDRLGDNGIVAIVAGRVVGRDLMIDTWLMSCRVLGRKVEHATLNIVVQEARRRGLARLVGEYQPTAKNGMVADLYARLGFVQEETVSPYWSLDTAEFAALDAPMEILQMAELIDA